MREKGCLLRQDILHSGTITDFPLELVKALRWDTEGALQLSVIIRYEMKLENMRSRRGFFILEGAHGDRT